MAGRMDLRWQRAALPAALVSGSALLAGCFGGSTTTVQTTTTTTTSASGIANLSATIVPKGPTDVTENITQLVTKDYDQLQDIQIKCPPNLPTPPPYPVVCTMHGIDTSKLSRRDRPDGEHRPVSGKLAIQGVYTPTKTYAFTLNYVPDFTLKPGYKPQQHKKK